MDKFVKTGVVICTNNKGFVGQLTIGKEYVCLYYQKCQDSIMVRNDLGKKVSYGSSNFKPKI